MVCAKCATKQKPTSLATPSVKRKVEHYYGSPASTSASSSNKITKSATVGNSGVGKSKLLGKGAKNPYAAYSASCETCKTKVDQGKKLCNACAYKKNGQCSCRIRNMLCMLTYAFFKSAQCAAKVNLMPVEKVRPYKDRSSLQNKQYLKETGRRFQW